jgi:sec-independent protein translocase protein TatA
VRFGMWEILLIALVILLLFGATRIPDLMRGLAKGIRGFKDEMKAEDKPEGAGEKPKPS